MLNVFVVTILSTVFASQAHGDESRLTNAPFSSWRSNSQIGFAVERQSSLGFKNVGGSTLMLGVETDLGPSVAGGLTTLAFGGEKRGTRYYRMGLGPVLGVQITERWHIGGGLYYFSESGIGQGRTKAYRSEGSGLFLGWERASRLTSKVSLTYGGFLAAHRGNMDLMEGAYASQGLSLKAAANVGLTQGLRIALKTDL